MLTKRELARTKAILVEKIGEHYAAGKYHIHNIIHGKICFMCNTFITLIVYEADK